MDLSAFTVEANCLGAVENTVFLSLRIEKFLSQLNYFQVLTSIIEIQIHK